LDVTLRHQLGDIHASPGVKLPGLLSVNGQLEPITVLECVLRRAPRDGAQKLDRCIENGGSQSLQVTLDFSPSPTSLFLTQAYLDLSENRGPPIQMSYQRFSLFKNQANG